MSTKIRIGRNVIKHVKHVNFTKYKPVGLKRSSSTLSNLSTVSNYSNYSAISSGSKAQLSGMLYEQKVLNVCKKLRIARQGILHNCRNNFNNFKNSKNSKTKQRNENFCNQKISDLGGSSARHDLTCKFNGKPIHIEIKKCGTPDWMQMSIMKTMNTWHAKEHTKIPKSSVSIFNNILKEYELFHNKIPPFMHRNVTHGQWVILKRRTNYFRDMYIDCPSDTISRLYKEKGTHYIQVSDYGLYHTGEDPCGFGVPYFECEQELRIRTKIHSRNLTGFMKASVIAAAKPVDITKLEKSPISLDNFESLPIGLELK